MGYICQNCDHASGYHTTIKEEDGIRYGKCHPSFCDCEEFIWDEEQRKIVNDKIKLREVNLKRTGEEK